MRSKFRIIANDDPNSYRIENSHGEVVGTITDYAFGKYIEELENEIRKCEKDGENYCQHAVICPFDDW